MPPQSDVAGVCISGTPGTTPTPGCATGSPTGLQVITPTAIPPTATPGPQTYVVKSGDTLSRICGNEVPSMPLDVCIDTIVSLSSLGGPDELTEGQSLRIPPRSGSNTSVTTPSAPAPTATPVIEVVPDPEPEVEVEVVTETEDTTVVEEEASEEITEDESTEEATEEEATDEEADPSPTAPTDDEIEASAGSAYTIEEGDSLLGICVSLVPEMNEGDCVEFVVLLNSLAGPDDIRYGQEIFLP